MNSIYTIRKAVRVGVALLALVTTLFAGSSLFAQDQPLKLASLRQGKMRWNSSDKSTRSLLV